MFSSSHTIAVDNRSRKICCYSYCNLILIVLMLTFSTSRGLLAASGDAGAGGTADDSTLFASTSIYDVFTATITAGQTGAAATRNLLWMEVDNCTSHNWCEFDHYCALSRVDNNDRFYVNETSCQPCYLCTDGNGPLPFDFVTEAGRDATNNVVVGSYDADNDCPTKCQAQLSCSDDSDCPKGSSYCRSDWNVCARCTEHECYNDDSVDLECPESCKCTTSDDCPMDSNEFCTLFHSASNELVGPTCFKCHSNFRHAF